MSCYFIAMRLPCPGLLFLAGSLEGRCIPQPQAGYEWPHADMQIICKMAEGCYRATTGMRNLEGITCRDVLPGEMVVITPEGRLVSRQCAAGQTCPCIFEYIYLARPDSVLNDISVYNFQLGLGTRLAQRIRYASLI